MPLFVCHYFINIYLYRCYFYSHFLYTTLRRQSNFISTRVRTRTRTLDVSRTCLPVHHRPREYIHVKCRNVFRVLDGLVLKLRLFFAGVETFGIVVSCVFNIACTAIIKGCNSWGTITSTKDYTSILQVCWRFLRFTNDFL